MQFPRVSRTYFVALLCGVFGCGGSLFIGKYAQAECGDYVIMMGDSHKEDQPRPQSHPNLTLVEEVDSQIIFGHGRLNAATLRLPENTPCQGWNCRAKFPSDIPAAPRHFDGGAKSLGMMTTTASQGWETTREPFRGHDGSAFLREGFRNPVERPPQHS